MNDGPLCKCSAKARRTGIRHSIYPGEEVRHGRDKSHGLNLAGCGWGKDVVVLLERQTFTRPRSSAPCGGWRNRSMKAMDSLMSVWFSQRLINLNPQVNAGCRRFFPSSVTFQALK